MSLVGAEIGPYRIVSTIGEGGMGTVYVGEHRLIGNRAAVKVLRPGFSSDPDIVERFHREARAATAVKDPGIVQIFDLGFTDDRRAYIAMELLEGESLASRIARGPMPVGDALTIIRQVATTLDAVHWAGVVHRDIKPDNIFLVPDREITGAIRTKVLDFGIAKLKDTADTKLTASGAIMGTPAYMGPEQINDTGSVDARTDIYSLGCVFYELLVGQPPFAATSITEIWYRQANTKPVRPSARRSSVPRELDRVVLRCLEKNPRDRFQTMGELAEAIVKVGGTQAATIFHPASGGGDPSAHLKSTIMLAGVEPVALVDTPSSSFEQCFGSVIPASLRDSLSCLVGFFGEFFSSAEVVDDNALELGDPTAQVLVSRSHYVLFLEEIEADSQAPMGRIGTMAFRAHVDPLADSLQRLNVPSGAVLIAVLAAAQIGQGARETILSLRRERGLWVVPIALSEIKRATAIGNSRLLLLNRIADLHTASDPFSMSDRFTDPTQCIGFASEVADLVKAITAGGRIVSVAGPPGSGKTSVVAMAEYGCDTTHVSRQFVRISLAELSASPPDTVIALVAKRIERLVSNPPASGLPAMDPAPVAAPVGNGEIRDTIMNLGNRGATLAGVGERRPRRETGLAKRHQLVLVLEDADWLIRNASTLEPNPALREQARELWRSLAELCSVGAHTVIVTSVRDFQVLDQAAFQRPVPVVRVPMRPLSQVESDHLVLSLGELIAFKPEASALVRLHRESGGNVYALRLLCSSILRVAREQPTYSPLGDILVEASMVDDAALHIAATGSTFRPHVSIWLESIERTVLQHVAREHPRSARRIRKAMKGIAGDEAVSKALDGLELMNLVEHKHGRHRVCVPVFERWINIHLDTPPSRDHALQQQRIARIAIGCTLTALLFGVYWTWLRSTRSTSAATLAMCTFEVDRPDRVADEPFDILVYQDCFGSSEGHAVSIEPVLSSLTVKSWHSNCTAMSGSCTTKITVEAGAQAHDEYVFRIRVDATSLLTASVEKDRFATIRAIGEKSLPAVSFIPLLLGLFIAFHKDMKKQLFRMFVGDADDTAPGEQKG